MIVILLLKVVSGCFKARDVIDKTSGIFCDGFNESVSYADLGTFDSSYWKCKPETAKKLNPQMFMYSSTVPSGEYVSWNDSSSIINHVPSRLVVFTHGYLDSINRSDSTDWMVPARRTLLNLTDPPAVILYDWSAGAGRFWNYGQAASNTQVAGRILGNFIYQLKLRKPSLYVHLVGHSLGSHVCGQAGSWLRQKSNGSFVVDRIDGLDPAGPLFLDEKSINKSMKKSIKKLKSDDEEDNSEEADGFFKGFDFQWLIKKLQGGDVKRPPKVATDLRVETTQLVAAPMESRLDRTDAHFVTVIHTNAYGFGVFENVGHVDFWPDGGILQTGCLPLLEMLDGQMSKCSHRFSHNVWAQSIKDRILVTNRCSDNVEMYEISERLCPSALNQTRQYFGYYAEKPTERQLRNQPLIVQQSAPNNFYYINSTTNFPDIHISNNVENGIRTTGIFLPTLFILATGLGIWRCAVRYRRRRSRSSAQQSSNMISESQYTEAQISPNLNPT